MGFSQRLLKLYEQLRPGEPVWDVACDHGLLGLRALKAGIFPEVHFVDPVPEIILKLSNRLKGESFEQERTRAHLHVMPFSQVQEKISGTVVMAGVGAHTILNEVVALSAQVYFEPQRLVLSPHRDGAIFLKKFNEMNLKFQIKDEIKILERGRERQIFVFQKTESH